MLVAAGARRPEARWAGQRTTAQPVVWASIRRGRSGPARLGVGARLGDPGDRGLAAGLGQRRSTAPCVYLDGVGDPGNVGTIVRTAHALLDATVALGPDCADPFGPKATRASMGSIFARPPREGRRVEATPEPRVALVAHGGDGLDALAGAATLCLGAEREGLPDEVLAACARPRRSRSPAAPSR